jgi:hypothetical protein
MHRAMWTMSVLSAAFAAASWFGLGLPSAFADPTPKLEFCCQQRTICGSTGASNCEASTSDCGNRTCPAPCVAVGRLICVPMENKTCNETDVEWCPHVNVPTCKAPSGGGEPTSCWCDPNESAGMADCGDETRCIMGASGC